MEKEGPLRKRGPIPISEVIPELTRGLGEDVLKREKIASLWQKVVGKKKGLHAKAATFENGVLTVVIDNSSSLYELSLEKEAILQKLQKELGHREVKEIRFQVGNLTEN